MNSFERISRNAQEMDRLTKGQTTKEYYSTPRQKFRKVRKILLFFLLSLLLFLILIWDRITIIWLVH